MVRVLVVEDSPVAQQLLVHAIDTHPHLKVVGCAANASEAMEKIATLDPDVISMDIRLPGQNGLDLTRRIMTEHPLPIVVVASDVDDRSLGISMNALRAGALTVVEKPPGLKRGDWDRLAGHLGTQLFIMSQVKVVRQRVVPSRAGVPTPPPIPEGKPFGIVAIGASTGGPGALSKVLGRLPSDFPLPILVVQHIGDPFMAGFAQWLGSTCALRVELATGGLAPLPGHVYVAPGNRHLVLDRGRMALTDDPPVQGQKPAADALFHSLALAHGTRSVGVLLTGMGEDGARGLLALREAGGYTIAEDKRSAVIWGMPGKAVALGAATEELMLDAVPERLMHLARATPREEAS